MKTINKIIGILFLFGLLSILVLSCMNEDTSGAIYGTSFTGLYLLLYVVINGCKYNKQNEELYLKGKDHERQGN